MIRVERAFKIEEFLLITTNIYNNNVIHGTINTHNYYINLINSILHYIRHLIATCISLTTSDTKLTWVSECVQVALLPRVKSEMDIWGCLCHLRVSTTFRVWRPSKNKCYCGNVYFAMLLAMKVLLIMTSLKRKY